MGLDTSDPRLSSPSAIKIKSNPAVPSTFIDGGEPSLAEEGTVPTRSANANGSGRPRVHVCATCQRSFGRLEHVKRHELSHTKEKPFECEKCARRFSRRDLLRRHQKKVHQMLNPTSHLYKRRESTSAVTPGQNIRKSNVADINSARFCSTTPLRLFADAISDVDSATTSVPASVDTLNPNPNLAGLPAYTLDHDFGDLPAVVGQSSISYGLPILETEQTGHSDFDSINLRTSPLNPELGAEGVCVKLGSTISPGEIHFNTSPQLMFMDQASPFRRNSNDVVLAQEFSESWTG